MELALGERNGDSWAVVKSFIDFISKTHIVPLCLFQSFKELINCPTSPPGKPSLWGGSNEMKPRSKRVARPQALPPFCQLRTKRKDLPAPFHSTEV